MNNRTLLSILILGIAVLLALHFVKPLFISTAVANKWMDVNIVAIDVKGICGSDPFNKPEALFGRTYLPVKTVE